MPWFLLVCFGTFICWHIGNLDIRGRPSRSRTLRALQRKPLRWHSGGTAPGLLPGGNTTKMSVSQAGGLPFMQMATSHRLFRSWLGSAGRWHEQQILVTEWKDGASRSTADCGELFQSSQDLERLSLSSCRSEGSPQPVLQQPGGPPAWDLPSGLAQIQNCALTLHTLLRGMPGTPRLFIWPQRLEGPPDWGECKSALDIIYGNGLQTFTPYLYCFFKTT